MTPIDDLIEKWKANDNALTTWWTARRELSEALAKSKDSRLAKPTLKVGDEVVFVVYSAPCTVISDTSDLGYVNLRMADGATIEQVSLWNIKRVKE